VCKFVFLNKLVILRTEECECAKGVHIVVAVDVLCRAVRCVPVLLWVCCVVLCAVFLCSCLI
jgi:hypothetical protein